MITTAFSTLWPHPLGIHAGFWGLMINLPVFVAVSLITSATNADVVERFFRISAPRGLTYVGKKSERVDIAAGRVG